MEIKINVEIGASKELTTILNGFLQAIQPNEQTKNRICQEQIVKALTHQCDEQAPEKEKEQPKAEEPAEAEQEKEQPKEEPKPITYTAEDVRKAMKECHARFEGEDFETNTDSENYKKYHKALNAWFKNIASQCGASDSRPSSLAVEQRKQFIDDCAMTILGEDGNFTLTTPF